MNSQASALIVLLVLAFGTSDVCGSWGSGLSKFVRKVGQTLSKHKRPILKGALTAAGLLAGDEDIEKNLKSLKNEDPDSYFEFLLSARDAMEEMYPDADAKTLVRALDAVASANDDEIEEMLRDSRRYNLH